METAVILVGGLGERLRPLTNSTPKPLVQVNGIPFLRYQLAILRDQGIRRVLLLSGYQSHVVTQHFVEQPVDNMTVEVIAGEVCWGTGKRVVHALAYLSENFLLLYGDNYWAGPLIELYEFYQALGRRSTVTVFANGQGTAEYGCSNNIAVCSNIVQTYVGAPQRNSQLNGVDIGFFITTPAAFPAEVHDAYCLRDWMQAQVAENQMGAFVTEHQYYFITNPYHHLMFGHYAKLKALEYV